MDVDVLDEQLDALSEESTRCLVALSPVEAATPPARGGHETQPPTVPEVKDTSLA